jgi:hypothetical protein
MAIWLIGGIAVPGLSACRVRALMAVRRVNYP